jgi:hypothetical protein
MNTNRLRTKFIQKDSCENLICYNCNKYLPLDCFDTNKTAWFREYKDRRCKDCKNKQYLNRKLLDHNRISLNRILLSRWHGLKDRANKNGYKVTFDWKYLKDLWDAQEGKCAISGINMTYEMFNGRIPTNVSVDRINSSLGYEIDNIQLVCMAVNQMKSDMTTEQLLFFCKQIVNNNE